MDNLKYVYESVCRKLLREIELGKVEFSTNRVDGVDKTEPDTPDEQRLYTMLTSWFGGAVERPGLASDLMAAADDPRYSDFFRWVPDGVTLYRGMDMNDGPLARMLGVDINELDSLGGRRDRPFVVKPRGGKGVTSWTTKLSEAERFASHGGSAWWVVVRTVTGPETGRFIDAGAMAAKVSNWRQFRGEGEALALGPVRAVGATWTSWW